MKTTINLEHELISANKEQQESLLHLREYEKHTELANNATLTRIGIIGALKQGKAIKDKITATNQVLKQFDKSRVLHISQIEAVCNKYYLKCLPAHHYQGQIDDQLPLKVDTFELAHGIKMQQSNTFIIAPRESFRLEEKPKDPVLLYQIDEEHFYIVHKWGNDLTVFRRLKAILSSVIVSYLIIMIPLQVIIIYLYTLEFSVRATVGLIVFQIIATFITTASFAIEKTSFYTPNRFDSIYRD